MGNTPFPPRVQLDGVSRVYGRSFALHRVDLSLTAGSITAIVGDNGAGKSTLLNILATVDRPTSGEVYYGEMPMAEFARRGRHRIGWISHDSPLYAELTARENLEFVGRMYGIDDIEPRVRSWLRRVELEADADRPVGDFSRGMKQRLTIARALLQRPQLLLFDEPATGLDQTGTRDVAELLDELRNRDRIVVIVSHDLDLLTELADRAVVLRRGKVAAEHVLTTPDDLTDMYRAHA